MEAVSAKVGYIKWGNRLSNILLGLKKRCDNQTKMLIRGEGGVGLAPERILKTIQESESVLLN